MKKGKRDGRAYFSHPKARGNLISGATVFGLEWKLSGEEKLAAFLFRASKAGGQRLEGDCKKNTI